MNVKRFFAPTAREALRRVKEDFGPDAIVLSNRSLDDGVEIMAMQPQELASLQAAAIPPAPRPQPAAPVRKAAPAPTDADADDQDFQVSLSARVAQRAGAPAWTPFVAARAEHAPQAATPPAPARHAAPHPVTPAPGEAPAAPQAARPIEVPDSVREELSALRKLVEQQLAGFAWGAMSREAPAKSALLGELLEAGFSGELARRLVAELPAQSELAGARAAIRNLINRDLLAIGSDADLIDRGGVYALVGPTGVGKTTTTAKLAARCVVRHGADKLALLTTDGYRIGAHEQLRIYGRILGVPVHVVRDGSDLRNTLAELRHKHMVLIDTVGMSQRDRAVAEQAAMLMHAGPVKRLLLLNATSRGDTLDDVVSAWRGPDLAGAVITKVDEAASLAPAIDALVRHELPLFYVANGQRVPEDLHLPNRPYLLHRALKAVSEQSPHHLAADEAGLWLAAQGA